MIRLIIIDSQLRMLRPHENFTRLSYYQIACMLAKSVITQLCNSQAYGYISVGNTNKSNWKNSFSTFSKDVAVLHEEIDQLQSLKHPQFISHPTAVIIMKMVAELFTYYGPWSNIQVIVFTDGESSCFTLPNSDNDEWISLLPKELCNISFLFVSLTHQQISPDLVGLYKNFETNSLIIEAGKLVPSSKAKTLDAFLEYFTEQIIENCVVKNNSKIENHLTNITHSNSFNLIVSCGRLQGVGNLIPAPGVNGMNRLTDLTNSIYVEIFGFLNLTDLSNAPVNGRFVIVSSVVSSEADFLSLLLNSIQSTKTIAMCNIYTNSLTNSTITQPNHEQIKQINSISYKFWSHGYLHPVDMKQSILYLSVFEQKCDGLPWLGQFIHLAPVSDFTGSQLYDDRNEISPFPVRTSDHLSYRAEASRYVSWVSQSTMLADINKVLRLSRRLPDKSSLLYKELNRLRSAALVYGCPELLTIVYNLICSFHSNVLENASNELCTILQSCLDQVAKLLLLFKNDNDNIDQTIETKT